MYSNSAFLDGRRKACGNGSARSGIAILFHAFAASLCRCEAHRSVMTTVAISPPHIQLRGSGSHLAQSTPTGRLS